MQLDHVVRLAISRLIGRLIRRMTVVVVLALCLVAAAYHLTIMGTLVLQNLYGPIHARLIVAGVFVILAAVAAIYLLATRAKVPVPKTSSRPHRARHHVPQDVRMAMLLESILLGYASARSKSRHP